MFELNISGLHGAVPLIEVGWPTRVISLITDDITLIGDHHRRYHFHDIDGPTVGYVHPTMDDLLAILEWSKDFTDEDRILIHCLAGISRSTAIAIGILIQHGMGFAEAFECVKTIRPILLPNRLLIEYIDQHFRLDGALIAHAQHHRETATAPLLSFENVIDDP